MKGVFTFAMSILFAASIDAQSGFSRFSVFANTGQALPAGAFKASDHSENPLEIARSEPFARSYNIGFDIYPWKYFGMTAGSSFYSIQPDKKTFEHIHRSDASMTDSYLNDYDFNMVHAGLKSRFVVSRFSFEIALMVGIADNEVDYSEAYLLAENGEVYKTIYHNYNQAFMAVYQTSLNLNVHLVKLDLMRVGIHGIASLSYMNPEITRITTTSDRITDHIDETTTVYHQSMLLFYYGLGLKITYGNSGRDQSRNTAWR